MLEHEFQYYLQNQQKLVSLYNGKFIAIVGEEVVAVGDSNLDVLNEVKERYPVGTFLIQKCSPGNTDYTQTFHSRVSLV